mmetsp:Transcript_23562/g.51098  ORF Transcript_23562/g.51098 Transcript_23562/m.51098 type:complete len:91 (-) Transcript_23562:351-623(-)
MIIVPNIVQSPAIIPSKSPSRTIFSITAAAGAAPGISYSTETRDEAVRRMEDIDGTGAPATSTSSGSFVVDGARETDPARGRLPIPPTGT